MGSLIKIRIRIENLSALPRDTQARRSRALRHALIGAHTLLGVRAGAFVSLLDPPEWARQAVASCAYLHTWPVLVGDDGERDIIQCSPVILSGYPRSPRAGP